MTTGRVTFFPFYLIMVLMSLRIADRKMDESFQALMANPIKDAVTAYEMKLKIATKNYLLDL